MRDQTREIFEQVRTRLRSAGRRILIAQLLNGLVILVGCLALFWLVAVALESFLWLPTAGRTAIAALGIVLLAGIFAWGVGRRSLQLAGLLAQPDEDVVARRIEVAVPATRDHLLSFLHLSTGRHSRSPEPLLDGAIHELYRRIEDQSFEPVEQFRQVRYSARLITAPLLLLLLFSVSAPTAFFGSSARLLRPGTAYVKPAPFVLLVSPGDAEVVRGDSLTIRVSVDGALTDDVQIESRRAGERTVARETPRRNDTRHFAHTVPNVRYDFDYRAIAGDVSSRWYTVTMLERPVVGHLQVSVVSPRYSRLGRTALQPNVGDVTALPGSKVEISATVVGAPNTAEIVFDDGSRIALSVEDDQAAGTFTLTRAGTYRIELVGDAGIRNANPITYRLDLMSDEDPAAVIVQPEPVSSLVEPFEPALSIRITDDYGFRGLSLFYRLAGSRFGVTSEEFTELPLSIDDPFQLDQVINRLWRLSEESDLDPVPGDVIEYFVRVWDNDTFAGFKSADSKLHQLVMPSLAEQYEQVGDLADDSQDKLEELLERAGDVSEQFRELRDELRRKPESDWDDARQLENLQDLEQQMQEEIEQVVDQIDQLTREMDENDLVSDETLDMFEELRKVVEEISSPELMEALKKLQEAMMNMDLQQMQQAIEDFEFNEEQFRERLERSLELFKRLQVRQVLEEAARRAEELMKTEQQIEKQTEELARDVDSTEQSDSARNELQRRAEEVARQQEEAQQEMRDVERRLEEAQEMMEELPRTPSGQLEELRNRLDEQQLPEQMRKNAEQLRQQQMQPAMQNQQQMQQQLMNLQQNLQELTESMQGRQLQVNIAGLRQALNDVLVLSQQQESVRSDVATMASNSPALRHFAKNQIELGEGLRVVNDSLRSLAREIPEMSRQVQIQTGSALREMERATEALSDRSSRSAAGHQKASMMHLNELALLLSDLLDMLMNQQMGVGMPSMQQLIDQLQQMAGQQQQLNQQIQEMLNDMQGQRLSNDVQARMRQLAEQQERIKQQLKELSRNPELRGKSLGDLERIAEQMEETIQELQQFRTERDLQQRQQQILTRLLDASRSIHQRGKEERRESRTGGEGVRESPEEFTPEERADQLRRDLIRALESGYATDYEELIKRYFELLQQNDRPDASE